MTLQQTLAVLEAAGTAQNRKVYRRHGVDRQMFGVSYAVLGKLAKKIRIDQELAEGLWRSGNHDARVLATMIADPTAIPARQLDAWARDLDSYIIADAFSGLVAKSPHARRKFEIWTRRKNDFVGQAGWNILSHLTRGGGSELDDTFLDDTFLEDQLALIESEIHDRPNRTRHAMNLALISIGIRSARLEKKALAAARRIGPVEVDHGETGCKTPDAVPYIRRARKRLRDRKSKTAAGRRGG